MNNPYYMNNNQPQGTQSINQNPYITAPFPQYSAQSTTPESLQKKSTATSEFVKGALIGAAVTWLLTNDKVQNALFKTAATTSSFFQEGMEEMKERFEDAKAEVSAANFEE